MTDAERIAQLEKENALLRRLMKAETAAAHCHGRRPDPYDEREAKHFDDVLHEVNAARAAMAEHERAVAAADASL